MTTPPDELHDAVAVQLDAVQAIRRRLAELSREYARLDVDRLAVDELGEVMAPSAAVAGARDALADLDRALGAATDAVYAAMRHTSRLYSR